MHARDGRLSCAIVFGVVMILCVACILYETCADRFSYWYGRGMGCVGATAVAAMLEDKTKLSTLLLDLNGIGPEGAEVIMNWRGVHCQG